MTELEDRILSHLGLYQISFAQVIERQFLDDEPCGHLMNQLAARRRIHIRKGLPGHSSKYYQLTRGELKRRGLTPWRAKRPKSQAFPTAISILWFCNMLGAERHLLESTDAAGPFRSGLPEGTHCIERNSDGHRLYRIRVADPHSDADLSCLRRSLRKRVSQAVTFPGLRPWVSSGRYSFVVLTECESHARSIRQMIVDDDLTSSCGTVVVEVTPGLNSLAEAVQSRT